MFVSFFESIKYVGHLFPISFLRVFLGCYYAQLATAQFRGDFLNRPKLAAQIAESLPSLQLPVWYRHVIEFYVIPHWEILAFVVIGLECALAISYLIGYVVRPVALLGALLCLNLLALSGAQFEDLYKTLFAIHLMMAWLGAGRCLGVDYYFYKRRRGIWW